MATDQTSDPRQVRIGLIKELLRAAEDDDIDDYPAAYDALIAFEQELGDYDGRDEEEPQQYIDLLPILFGPPTGGGGS